MIRQGGPRAVIVRTHTQSIIEGREDIIHGDIITHMITNTSQVLLKSDYFPFEQEQAQTLMVERKIIAFEQNLASICDHMSDDVAMNYVFPTFNDALGMGSSDNSPRSSLPNHIEFCDNWIFC